MEGEEEMPSRGSDQWMSQLSREYTRRFAHSAELHQEAKGHLVDGESHAVRTYRPFPIRITSARGSRVRDVDGHDIIDLWQGHYANILGHNPEVVTSALARGLLSGWGLQTGHIDRLQGEAAELIKQQTGTDQVRFSTSGTLATMYAILLARAFTARDVVLKVGGGWHGSQPWGLKGVHFGTQGYNEVESAGLPGTVTENILITRYNDLDDLEEQFRTHGDRIACFIVEPWRGAIFIPGRPEYLRSARALADTYGAVLIFDEVQTGFRFRAGDVGAMYGVAPDLMVFGKIVGGGMPVTAVAGKKQVMEMCSTSHKLRARFDGGTYSAHPASMLAAKVMLEYLVEHEAQVYARLADIGQKTREGIEAAFAKYGQCARCTGYGNGAVPGSSVGAVHFPLREDVNWDSPDETEDPTICDVALRDEVLKLALLLQDVYVMHGLGALSTAHTNEDVQDLLAAFEAVARRLQERAESSRR
jgi:glutamate-1-semialdehyde 2,1-aminomutase